MEHKAAKLGTAVAAAILGLGLPALASAQEYPSPLDTADPAMPAAPDADQTTAPQLMPIGDAMAAAGDTAQRLSSMDPISSDDVVVVSLNDLGMSADQRYSLMQNADPSGEASLQQALGTVQVLENGGSLGGYQRSLAQHLRMLGADPAAVVAATIDPDGTVTVYTQ